MLNRLNVLRTKNHKKEAPKLLFSFSVSKPMAGIRRITKGAVRWSLQFEIENHRIASVSVSRGRDGANEKWRLLAPFALLLNHSTKSHHHQHRSCSTSRINSWSTSSPAWACSNRSCYHWCTLFEIYMLHCFWRTISFNIEWFARVQVFCGVCVLSRERAAHSAP